MIEAVLIGAGQRGIYAYASYALERPGELRFTAVAEPNEKRRKQFAQLHGIPAERCFSSWEELLNQPKLGDAALICTQDDMHFEPTMKAIAKGYSIMLEKPMSPNPAETLRMAEEAEKHGSLLLVCHVLRYTPYIRSLKQLLTSGRIGRVMTIQWNENVGYWHQAHSFVRGNWRNSKQSSPMILAKCCHDMDVLHFLADSRCTMVSSFGSLSHFRPENAPAGSTERCIDGCAVESECLYSAVRTYYNAKDEWPQNVISDEPTLEARAKALREGPYGRCVYRCDNDVVDHQVVNLSFEDGMTVAFTMTAFTKQTNRTFKIMGTLGEIHGHLDKNEIEIISFNGRREMIYPEKHAGGHGGGDYSMIKEFLNRIKTGIGEKEDNAAAESAAGHMIAYAAEESRVTGQVVRMDEFITRYRGA